MTSLMTQILVHVDASAQNGPKMDAACRIGRKTGAAVTALYAVTPAMVDLPTLPAFDPGVLEGLRGFDVQRREEARKAFDEATRQLGPPVAWAEVSDYPVMSVFAQQALYADLLVLGQHHASAARFAGVPDDFVQSVMNASGKPAWIVPYTGMPDTTAETVMIAWKPTREAARAVLAAVPLLRQARTVHIVSMAELDEPVLGARLDLLSFLQSKGVAATWHREASEEPDAIGELLLSRACDLGADLMVLGCYGHSRAREWVLGGATRTVLQSMTLPVLMSH